MSLNWFSAIILMLMSCTNNPKPIWKPCIHFGLSHTFITQPLCCIQDKTAHFFGFQTDGITFHRWFKHSVTFSYVLFSHSLDCMICTSGLSILLCLHICFWFKNWFWSYHLLWINVPQVVGGEKIHYWQKLKYRESTMKTLAFNVFIWWKWLSTNHRYCDFNATPTCSVMKEKM